MVLVAMLALAARPLIIGHRGCPTLRPEHTLESYRVAIEEGADYIEPDLVMTKDGILVARHENEISTTTDVAAHPEFADRKRTKTVDGETVTGWFTEDFTLVELKRLRATERLPELRPKNTEYNGKFTIPTFSEILDFVKKQKRRVGVYPETKHPTYFRKLGLAMEPQLLDVLRRYGMDRPGSPVFIQSFEVGNLWALSQQTKLPLVQLVAASGRPYDFTVIEDERTFADLMKPDGLRFIASYASAIGVEKSLLIPRTPDGHLGTPTDLVNLAHRAGLKVHAWTFRDEDPFLPTEAKGHPELELRKFAELGIDGLFTDHPASAVSALGGK